MDCPIFERMKSHISILCLIGLFCLPFSGNAQTKKDKKVIELSGVVVTKDQFKHFVPYAHVVIKNRKQGVVTNEEGFFSFAAVEGDTIVISALGFTREILWVPDTLTSRSYLALVPLEPDTTLLEEVYVYPWPRELTPREFVNIKVETTELDIANRNLAIQALKERAAGMGYDAREMQAFAMKLQERQIYNEGRYYGPNGGAAIIGALSNPFAWAEFFEALKRK